MNKKKEEDKETKINLFLKKLLLLDDQKIKLFGVYREYERAVIMRLGRLITGGTKGPGLFMIMPCIDTFKMVSSSSLKTQIIVANLLNRIKTICGWRSLFCCYFFVQELKVFLFEITYSLSSKKAVFFFWKISINFYFIG